MLKYVKMVQVSLVQTDFRTDEKRNNRHLDENLSKSFGTSGRAIIWKKRKLFLLNPAKLFQEFPITKKTKKCSHTSKVCHLQQ